MREREEEPGQEIESTHERMRKEPRYSMVGAVGVRLHGEGTVVEGHIVDVSTDGVFVALDEPPFRVSSQVLVEFRNPYSQLVNTVRGSVLRVELDESEIGPRPPGVAIRFEAASDEEKERVRDIVRMTATFDLLRHKKRKEPKNKREAQAATAPWERSSLQKK